MVLTAQLSHLIAVILYTDFSKHCSAFSSTFRKTTAFETLQEIKIRNQDYWWMSKLLRETTEIFGDTSASNQLCGPFYTGLAVVIPIPKFSIRLNSPTSTTTQEEVALKFSGDDGVIVCLNNPKKNVTARLLRGFNCSFVSAFAEEDERYNYL